MKKAVGWIAILLMAFLVSCTPEISNSISDIEIPTEGVTTDVLVRVNEDSTVDLLFKAVPHATSYQYSIEDVKVLIDTHICGREGEYLVVDSITPNSVNGTIILTAKLDGFYIEVGRADYVTNVDGVIPDVLLMKRTEHEAVFSVDSVVDEIVYKVDIYQNETLVGSESFEELQEKMITISDLNAGAYTMVFSHKIKWDDNWGAKTESIEVAAYNKGEYSEMQLSYDRASGEFSVTDIPSDVSTINLAVRKDKSIIYEKKDIPVSATHAVINESVIDIPSLSEVEVYAYVGDNNTQGKSNPVRFTKPLTQIRDKKVNWQSVELFFDLADDIKESLEFTASCNNKSYQVENRKDGSIIITGLDSKSTYENITVTAKGYEEYPLVLDSVETNSFAGTYEWKGDVKCDYYDRLNGALVFSIRVENAPKNSDYNYYVFLSEKDPSSEGRNDIQIMPLIDTSVGDVKAPSINDNNEGGISVKSPGLDFSKANDAYLINSGKWNASTMTPDFWTILDTSINAKDKVITETKSVVNFFGSKIAATTTTSFMFEEDNGKPVIIFKNTGDFFAEMGLVYNVANANDKDKKYEFKLTQV